MPSHTYTRRLPMSEPTDVLVVGSGPSGLGAALAAARNGASVRLVERFGFLGGNLTAGLVGPCMTSFSLDGTTQLVRGIFDEFVRRMVRVGGAVHPSETRSGSPYSGFMVYGHEAVTPFDPEAAKLVALDMCQEAGVELLLHTFVADALTEDRRVTGVVVGNKSGLGVLPATTVVDCTGDGDVAARAGAGFDLGRDGDGQMQPMTLFFRVADVDDDAVRAYQDAHPEERFPFQGLVEQASADGSFTLPRRGIQLFKTLEPGVWRINTTRVLGLDGTDAGDLTAGEITARRQVVELMRFFRERLPGMENCRLLDTAATVGVRETRRIRGEHLLTLDELTSGHAFEDTVAVAGYPVDIHSPTGPNGPFDDGIPPTANIYEIPYRSLVPRDLDNLLLSGRCVSATHEALAAIRVMPPSFAMGEAAGAAAALAQRDGVLPRAVDVPALQRLLLAQGAYLGPRFESAPVS
ncbi:FAD-dependent oxidoreductase [Streptomyces aculeolatus]|jgi:2-polyprenyl-6-methoxyphenol hydroxylase-like FAD-dependent oxidoreductase